jgi:DNA-binding response OmpR family regulator
VEVATIILQNKGYTVVAITNGDTIFDKIKSARPNVILLDLWMPHRTGEEITRELKSNKDTKDIPIIIVSASKDTEKVSRRIGADDFICKPFDIEVLEALVDKYAARSHTV